MSVYYKLLQQQKTQYVSRSIYNNKQLGLASKCYTNFHKNDGCVGVRHGDTRANMQTVKTSRQITLINNITNN